MRVLDAGDCAGVGVLPFDTRLLDEGVDGAVDDLQHLSDEFGMQNPLIGLKRPAFAG
jgi:hypothetical protein